jgi:hypothetical protein
MPTKSEILISAGIAPKEANRCEAIAALPKKAFEAAAGTMASAATWCAAVKGSSVRAGCVVHFIPWYKRNFSAFAAAQRPGGGGEYSLVNNAACRVVSAAKTTGASRLRHRPVKGQGCRWSLAFEAIDDFRQGIVVSP